ncbi:MAG TPA: putative Ig domain-containing protein, partial [Microthrixaceae bacterium]|nr:putative Ig domain-containing protein [Microthrixaceae bacterium]
TITGSFSTPQQRNINISISDEHTDRVTSKPLALTVLPLMTLTGPQLAKLEAQAAIPPVVVTAGNVAGTIAWQELDSNQKDLLPEGISFDTATGSFVGQTDEIGTFGPFTVSAIDTFHGFTDRGVSNPITLEINPGSTYLNLRDSALPDGTKRIASYSYDFMAGNLDLAGIDESSLTWTMTAEQGTKTPPGLTLNSQTGILSGMPKESGSFRFAVRAASGGKASARSFALNVGLPATEMTLAASNPPGGERGVSYTFDMKNRLATKNIPTSDVKWTSSSDVTPGTGEIAGLPAGITLNKDTGILSGTPTSVGTFKFATKAVWDESNPTAEHAGADALYVIVINGVSYKFVQLSGGNSHTCGLTANGGVQCWGAGNSGQLGNGLTDRSLVPVNVSGLGSGVASIAVGGDTSCAVTTSGSAKCWGRGDYGRLGNGTDLNSLVPTDVSGLTSGVKSISSGANHSCVVLTTGTAKCWGSGSAYQLGNAQSITSTNVPVDVKSLTSVSSITVGQTHTCALTSTGAAKCWGNGANGRLGNSLDYTYAVPADVTGLTSGVKAISAGGTFTCAILQNDRVNCWGANSSGQLGIGSTTEYNYPRTVGAFTASRIATGGDFACAVTLAGNVHCWGRGAFGQMGAGTNVDTNVSPVSARVSSVQSVMAGTGHICVLTTSNDGKCWGNGDSGQLGDGKLVNSNLPVDVGSASAP